MFTPCTTNACRFIIMKKPNKYNYFGVIQQNYGQGWEDASQYETCSQYRTLEKTDKFKETKTGRKIYISLLTHDLKEYILLGYATRVINRKELNAELI